LHRHDLCARFEAEVEAKWDEETLCKNIVTSQKRRALIREALKSGSPTRWNHDESAGDKVLWYRGETTYSDWAFNYLPNVD
jgi:choline-sulfatase